MNATHAEETVCDVVVVGGGAAGVGVSIALKDAGVEELIVLERHEIGASFARWPAETRFITPSFPTNSVGMLDLNSIAIGVSPAYSMQVEHPTGPAYAKHLARVARYFEVPVKEQTNVEKVAPVEEGFRIVTDGGVIWAKHVVWAAGEFQYPRLLAFVGALHCRHTATVASYGDLEGEAFIIIGGYESGVDAAYHLACRGKEVLLLDSGCPWAEDHSDPSVSLSTYSLERMRDPRFVEHVELAPNSLVTEVHEVDGGFKVVTEDGTVFGVDAPPLLAGGFIGGHGLVADLFTPREDGFPLLTKDDESTLVPGVFLCGPAVRHENHIFCYIFKYRQRFAVVAKAIATSLGLSAEGLEEYREWGMYLDDLEVCGEDCVC